MSVTTEQHMEALALANKIRLSRAKVKRELHDGKRNLIKTLAQPPACIKTASLEQILRACPWLGKKKTAKLCRMAKVPETRQIGELTERQRRSLVAVIRQYDGLWRRLYV